MHQEAKIYERDDVFEQGKFMNQLKFTESNLVWIRGLFQLIKAGVMANIRKLSHLEIDVQSQWAGLSDSRLGPQESKLIYAAFANLKPCSYVCITSDMARMPLDLLAAWLLP